VLLKLLLSLNVLGPANRPGQTSLLSRTTKKGCEVKPPRSFKVLSLWFIAQALIMNHQPLLHLLDHLLDRPGGQRFWSFDGQT
jgi:hypothetical protein